MNQPEYVSSGKSTPRGRRNAVRAVAVTFWVMGVALLIAAIMVGPMAQAAGSAADESGAGQGSEAPAPLEKLPSDVQKAVSQVRGAVALPAGDGVKALQIGGRLFFVSGNGRLIVEGAAYDTWTGREVTTMDEARRMANYIDFDELKVSLDQLDPLSFGNGGTEKRVVLATDPNCPQCRKLFDTIQQRPQIAQQFQFDVLLLPKSQQDGQAVRRYFCHDDEAEALKALFAGDAARLPAPDQSCQEKELSLRKRIATMYLLGLKKVPTVIAPNGRVHAGVPDDLEGFLQENL